ncbi:TonB-dependent receptor plug domain-containing protein [Aquimarina algiphila]|uniref:TonB-dependent receptor plug domain-containing protein n=1 Tax=Aquimarina algiphila TaxID=2047982 RepID=UPI0024917DFF|nr:TonB-dependent receptor plug domain-containing protein [Aquimarina algiphila]
MRTYKQNIKKSILILILSIASISFVNYSDNQELIEDIYTHVDRPFYFPGETIWFKSYVVDSEHKITTISDAMYAELISPKGTVVKQLKIRIHEGYAYGNFDTKQDWVGGIYTLKMYTNWMRNAGETSFFTKKITIQKVIQPELLLQLKFEKEGYGKGSKVIANFEVKDLKNNPLSHKEIQYEVAVKGKKILSDTVETDINGKAKPTFNLPKDLSTIDVVLNVLISYNGSTESISRSIPVVLDTIDLQFFPESGKIIAGTRSQIALKALNEFGKPVDVSGNIIDDTGAIVTNFSSYHDGMGSFMMNAIHETSYYAQITAPFISEKKIQLPKVYENGLRFSAITDSIQTTLTVFSTLKKSMHLEVANANKVLWKQNIKSDQQKIMIPTADLPVGITRFTFYDAQKIPIAERLVFINSHKKLKVEITTNKEHYETREKVEVQLKTTDDKGNPIPANLSIAVADHKLLSFADDKQDHILSYLLMSSELKGKIHKPVFYFDPEEPKAIKALDYVMLTHGWRDYIKPNTSTEDPALYLPEKEAIHSGTVVDTKGNPVKAHVLLFDQQGNKVLVFDTNKNGKFSCKLGKANTHIMIAYTDDHKSLRIIETTTEKGYDAQARNRLEDIKDNSRVKSFRGMKSPVQKIIRKKAKPAPIELSEDKSQLDEIVIVGNGIQQKRMISGSISTVKNEELEGQAAGSFVDALQGRVAGVNIVNADGIYGSSSKIMIRGTSSISGNNQPLFVIDGIPVANDEVGNLDADVIESITILKDIAATSLYGSRGANGVIVISSKHKKYFHNWGKKKLNNAKFNNYAYHYLYKGRSLTNYTPRVFYVPVYDSKMLPEERTDFRKTIYWNPVVQTNDKGEANLSFYNSDAITSFNIIAEGIGYNGLVGRKEKQYSTKKQLTIDFKIPNYMALQDTVRLPLTIKNESSDVLEAEVDLHLPKGIQQISSFDSEIKLQPNEVRQVYVQVVPLSVRANNRIVCSVKSEMYSDTVNKEVTVISPYFPTEVSVSGSQNKAYTFDVNSIVPNSLTADFTIYTDIVGDVMNGIESLIRQPHGCFEQTSSSTYPNIMVLKYLKESGRSNPEITAKAMKYIKEGYKRLISFETKEGGFEWFGHTPPHETLTAYGVLEFTEMKEIYPKVNQKMIDRTVDWLMSRRDGNGGFRKSKKGYDSFASSPKEVADAYIVYAISEAGIQVDIEKEYQTTYTKALKSNDTYRMALLAAASFNFGKNNNGNMLLNAITKNIEEYNFKALPVENTITRSYGDSKYVETAAFVVLAMLKAENRDDILITKGIEYIISKRNGGRFGSTQATSMALKALIGYTRTQRNKIIANNESVHLNLNGNTISKKLKINEKGQVVIDGLESYIKEGKQEMAVRFNNEDITFPYEMNIQWDSPVPDSSDECKLQLKTTLMNTRYEVGDNVRMTIEVNNQSTRGIAMPMAIVGIPSGTTPQPWQLKELVERKEVAYYEIFENYLIFYWREFTGSESKTIHLDLKADIPGVYKAPASCTYQYYADDYKHWISGNTVTIGVKQ